MVEKKIGRKLGARANQVTNNKNVNMTEKGTRFVDRPNNMTKPVPMKLFAAWEVDRTPPNCIPRYVLSF